MKAVISLASCAFSLGAQITATLNRIPNGGPEIRIRNQLRRQFGGVCDPYEPPVVRSGPNNALFMVYVDRAIDTTTPLLPNQERTFPVPMRRRLGQPAEGLSEQPIITAGILADGTTTGDAGLLTRLINRRSNML